MRNFDRGPVYAYVARILLTRFGAEAQDLAQRAADAKQDDPESIAIWQGVNAALADYALRGGMGAPQLRH